MARVKQSSTPSSTPSDLSEDTNTEEALKGFDFLASPDELDGSAEWRSGEDSGEWGETRRFKESPDVCEACSNDHSHYCCLAMDLCWCGTAKSGPDTSKHNKPASHPLLNKNINFSSHTRIQLL